MAAPTAAPPISASEMGVSITRSIAKLVEQAARGAIGAAVEAHILAHHKDARVAQHLFAQRVAHRLPIGLLAHGGVGAHALAQAPLGLDLAPALAESST